MTSGFKEKFIIFPLNLTFTHLLQNLTVQIKMLEWKQSDEEDDVCGKRTVYFAAFVIQDNAIWNNRETLT